MADQLDPVLDPALETRLRDALRAEADSIPFTLRADTVRRVGAERRRVRRAQRFSWLAAAAVVIVAVAGVAALSTLRGPSQIAGPTLSQLPSFGQLIAAGDGGLEVARDESDAATAAAQKSLPLTHANGSIEVVVACSGEPIAIAPASSGVPIRAAIDAACGGGAVSLRDLGGGALSQSASPSIVVTTPAGTAWRLVVLDRTDLAASPGATASAGPSGPSPTLPSDLPTADQLVAAAGPGAVRLADLSRAGASDASTYVFSGLGTRTALAVVVGCEGGRVEVDVANADGGDPQAVDTSYCDGAPKVVSWADNQNLIGRDQVIIKADADTAWAAAIVDTSRAPQDPAASPLASDALPALPDIVASPARMGVEIAASEPAGPSGGDISFGDTRASTAWQVLIACSGTGAGVMGEGVTVSVANLTNPTLAPAANPVCDGTVQSFTWTRGTPDANGGPIQIQALPNVAWRAVLFDATSALAPTAHKTPATTCGAPDLKAKVPPTATLYQGGKALGAVEYYTTGWGNTFSDGIPVTPDKAYEATSAPLVLRIAGDVCASDWGVTYSVAGPASGVDIRPVGLLAIQAASTSGRANQENRIDLAGLPSGDWVL